MGRTRPSGSQLRDESIDSSKILDNSVSSDDIKDGDVKLVDIDTNEINATTIPFDDADVNFTASTIKEAVEQVASLGGEAQYIDAYDKDGGTIVNATWTDIPLNKERKKSIAFQHDNALNNHEITIAEDTSIMFFAQAVCDTISGTSRTQTKMRIMHYKSGAWEEVEGSIKPMYNRQTDFHAHATAIGVLSVLAGEKFKIQLINEGLNTINSGIGTALTLVKFKGEKGEKGVQGDQGTQGDRGDDGQDGQDGSQGPQGEVGPQGEIGPQGDQGIQGEDGDPAERKDFPFTNLDEVVCTHNMNTLVDESVFTTTYSTGDNKLVGAFLVGTVGTGTSLQASNFQKLTDNDYTITNITLNSITVNFSTPTSGIVQLRK